MKYTCKKCGESRFFYVTVSVAAKQRIDLKEGSRHGIVYDIEPENIDGFYEDVIYCGKCDEQVDMEEWEEYQF
ncbi:hypothetical protein EDM57_04820 [Brevibacillus gelatini]|uniref:Uncharacterized protein n=1 Tax=Brevibacillus gelatini TaxID=1655277 RepID=A0A3M8B906_9BACL|nr:hypothetical protein [Brevibacillus gelatini]RNB59467.1 hypothetical protein EDM57_04820 [Brevibacillus gelatini]